MNVKERAEKEFKELNDMIEKASKTVDYEFRWRYEDIFINCQYETIKVDLGRTSQFKLLSIGEVNLVLRTFLKIYDLKQRALFKEVVVKDFTDITKQFRHIQAFLKEWRSYNENDSFNWLSEGEVAEIAIDGMINWLIVCLHHIIYVEGEFWARKTVEEDRTMNLKEFAEVRFKNLHDQLNRYNDYGEAVEFEYQNALKISGGGYHLSVIIGDLPVEAGSDFAHLTQGELVYIVNALRLIIDGYFKENTSRLEINGYTKPSEWIDTISLRFQRWCERMKRIYGSTNLLCQRIEDAFDFPYEEGSDAFCYFTFNKRLAEIERALDEDDFKQEDDVVQDNDNVHTYTSVFAFCWAFYSYQEDIVNSLDPFKLMLFSEDNSIKYISINVDKNNNVDVTFHETPREIELGDVVNIVRVMRTLMYKSYHTCEYGVNFNYASSPDAMLSYVKELIGHTPAKYKDCYIKYEELEDAEDKNLYTLYENAYLFLGKWLAFVAKWEEDQQTDQRPMMQSDNNNYYTDGNGQDMFAKFEALDDFREQRYALGFCYHNIEKYLIRAGRKTDDPTEDINKSLNYLHEYRKLEKIYFE